MSHERGFTLLEVLIAFVIAALALGVLFQGTTDSLGSVRVSGQYQEALSRARSHLEAAGLASWLTPGEQRGEDGHGFRWLVRTVAAGSVPVARGDAAAMAQGGRLGGRLVLYEVVVIVSWKSGIGQREVTLEARRLGLVPPVSP